MFDFTSVRLGAEYAAGIATALADSKYGELVEFVDYLSPHQPGGFDSPSKIKGRQFSTATDRVTSDAGPLGEFLNLFNGGSDLEQIPGTSDIIREKYRGGMGGHMVETWLNYPVAYRKSIGIKVDVEPYNIPVTTSFCSALIALRGMVHPS